MSHPKEDQLNIYYSHDGRQTKKVRAYARAENAVLNEVNLNEVDINPRVLSDLIEQSGASLSELTDGEITDKQFDQNDHDWLVILTKDPQKIKFPLVHFKGKTALVTEAYEMQDW